jgi:hypothetical protein
MQHMLPRFRKRATTTSVWPRRVVGMRSLLMQEVQVFICGYKKYVGSKMQELTVVPYLLVKRAWQSAESSGFCTSMGKVSTIPVVGVCVLFWLKKTQGCFLPKVCTSEEP